MPVPRLMTFGGSRARPGWTSSTRPPLHDAHRVLRGLVDAYDEQVDLLEEEIHVRLRRHSGYNAVQAIPGVGRTIGAIMVAEIGDIWRRLTPQALCSWAGSTPKHHESDTKVHTAGSPNRVQNWCGGRP